MKTSGSQNSSTLSKLYGGKRGAREKKLEMLKENRKSHANEDQGRVEVNTSECDSSLAAVDCEQECTANADPFEDPFPSNAKRARLIARHVSRNTHASSNEVSKKLLVLKQSVHIEELLNAQDEQAKKEEMKVHQEARRGGHKFTDSTFPPNEFSLFGQRGREAAGTFLASDILKLHCVWKRIESTKSDDVESAKYPDWVIFRGNIKPQQVIQGILGITLSIGISIILIS